jgi:hypothetical protein
VVVDDRHVDDPQLAESGVATEALKAAAAELPEDELVFRVDLAWTGYSDRAPLGALVPLESVGLEENATCESFSTVPLSPGQLAVALALATAPLVATEILKAWRRRAEEGVRC